MRISDWSSDVCSSDLRCTAALGGAGRRMLAHKGVVVIHQVPGDLASREPVLVDFCHRRHLHGGPRQEHLLRLRKLLRLGSEEHTSELQSLMRISYAVFCLQKTTQYNTPQAIDIDKHSTHQNSPA